MALHSEPRVRKDGTCALRGCGEALPVTSVTHGDPFHSSRCARTHHEITFPSDEATPRSRRSMVKR